MISLIALTKGQKLIPEWEGLSDKDYYLKKQKNSKNKQKNPKTD